MTDATPTPKAEEAAPNKPPLNLNCDHKGFTVPFVQENSVIKLKPAIAQPGLGAREIGICQTKTVICSNCGDVWGVMPKDVLEKMKAKDAKQN